MGLDIYWTDFAKRELKNIFDYYHKNVSLKIARQIVRQIIEKTNRLNEFPEVGVIEELLEKRPQNFRYIISTNYKIIYWVNNKKYRIEIADVFDTRQNPKKILKIK